MFYPRLWTRHEKNERKKKNKEKKHSTVLINLFVKSLHRIDNLIKSYLHTFSIF